MIQRFVDEFGTGLVDGTRRRPDGAWHYDFGQAVKEMLNGWLAAEARPADVYRWIEVLLHLRERAGLSSPGMSAAEIVDAAPAGPAPVDHGPDLRNDALIVSGALDHARYLEGHALILGADAQRPAGVTHVGFCARAIHEHVPSIEADLPNLLFDGSTVRQLRHTGKEIDARAAQLIEDCLAAEPDLEGTSHRVLLLSAPDDPSTLVLEAPIVNTKTIRERPVSWIVGNRVVPLSALAESPRTTSELDALIGQPRLPAPPSHEPEGSGRDIHLGEPAFAEVGLDPHRFPVTVTRDRTVRLGAAIQRYLADRFGLGMPPLSDPLPHEVQVALVRALPYAEVGNLVMGKRGRRAIIFTGDLARDRPRSPPTRPGRWPERSTTPSLGPGIEPTSTPTTGSNQTRPASRPGSDRCAASRPTAAPAP